MSVLDLDPFRRDGHLHDLGVDALVDDHLSDEDAARARAHLGACPPCHARVDEARAMRSHALPPLRTPAQAPPTPTAANRPWRAWVAPLSVAAAAVVAILALPSDPSGPPHDGLRVKGTRLSLEVWADEGASSRLLVTGSAARPDDRLGFRLATGQPGNLLVVGIDDAGEPWLGYPQKTDGHSMPVDAQGQPKPLDEAVRLDGREGHERILAMLCPTPFTYDEIAPALAASAANTAAGQPLPTIREGCIQSETRVDKVAPP